jgi:hypothetical protein
VLGLFGVSPEVTIRIQDFSAPTTLAFLMITEVVTNAGTFPIRFEMDPAIVPPGELTMSVEAGRRTAMAIQLPPLRLPRAGRYEVRVVSQGQVMFAAPFDVEQGTEDDFAPPRRPLHKS